MHLQHIPRKFITCSAHTLTRMSFLLVIFLASSMAAITVVKASPSLKVDKLVAADERSKLTVLVVLYWRCSDNRILWQIIFCDIFNIQLSIQYTISFQAFCQKAFYQMASFASPSGSLTMTCARAGGASRPSASPYWASSGSPPMTTWVTARLGSLGERLAWTNTFLITENNI